MGMTPTRNEAEAAAKVLRKKRWSDAVKLTDVTNARDIANEIRAEYDTDDPRRLAKIKPEKADAAKVLYTWFESIASTHTESTDGDNS